MVKNCTINGLRHLPSFFLYNLRSVERMHGRLTLAVITSKEAQNAEFSDAIDCGHSLSNFEHHSSVSGCSDGTAPARNRRDILGERAQVRRSVAEAACAIAAPNANRTFRRGDHL